MRLRHFALVEKAKAREHMDLAAGKYRLGYMGDVGHVHAELLRMVPSK